MRLGQHRIPEFLIDDVLLDEIDERIGFRVDVVLVQQDFGKLKNLAQTPGQRCNVAKKSLVVSKRVQSEALRGIRREILDALERLCLDIQFFVEDLVRLLDLPGHVEIAKVRTLDVEADRRNRSLVMRKMLEQRGEEPLD